MKMWEKQWIKICADGKRISQGDPLGWRVKIDSESDDIFVQSTRVHGTLKASNRKIGTNPWANSSEMRAWVSFFGSLILTDEHVLHLFCEDNGGELGTLRNTRHALHLRTWIYLAVSKQRMQNGDLRHWRCFLNHSNEEIPLLDCLVEGLSMCENHIFETSPVLNERKMIAWIRHFGNVFLTPDEHMLIELEPP